MKRLFNDGGLRRARLPEVERAARTVVSGPRTLRAKAGLAGLLGLLLATSACVETPPPLPPPAPPMRAAAAPLPAPLPPPPPVATVEPVAEEAPTDGEDPDAVDGETPDDEDYADAQTPGANGAASAKTTSPLLALSDAEIHARFKKDPASLGPLSVGKPNAGALVNGIMMPKGPKWTVLEPGLAWGTQETIDGLSKAIEKVHADFPGSQAIPIGHISSKSGGYLPVHKSHQAGRDVDVGYYFTTPQQYFVSGTKTNLDLPRTLAFVKALLTVSDIEMIFIDTSIQKLLCDYAVAHGEDAGWLDRTFQVRQKPVYAPIRHVRGHKNHIHVRFASPVAVAMGRRVAGLVAIRSAPPPGTGPKGTPAATAPGEKLVAHKARSGDTLVVLAKRYGTTIEAIQRVNGLKGSALKIGHVYQIPVPAPPVKGAPLPQKQAPQKHAKKGKTGG